VRPRRVTLSPHCGALISGLTEISTIQAQVG